MKIIVTLFMMAFALTATSQERDQKKTIITLPQWVKDIKLSGYGIVQYQGEDREGGKHNEFNLRLVRLSLDGKFSDFQWKLQFQANGNTSTQGSSPRLVDLWGEWQPKDYFRVKVGQFKRSFTLENPMHPITQGFFSYSQAITKLAGMNDRTGEHASNGRDIGVQIQGDVLKNGNGRNLLHYQIGVFNGEGINRKDADNRKDIIGGVWVMPVKGMRVGVFGWTGSHVINGESIGKNRYALSADYQTESDWTFRTEYVHSQGLGHNGSDFLGNRADAFYALCITPVISKKLYVKARYDLYRENKEWSQSKAYYEIGANYIFNKHLQLNIEYARVNNRTASKHNYNMVDVQFSIKF